MQIDLTAEQQAWLPACVARGDCLSVEDAARQLIDERVAERAVKAHDDLAWAKPLVDEALSEVACGDVISRGDCQARMASWLAELRK